MNIQITIDGKPLTVPEGLPIRKAAFKNGIYIPGICGHPYLPSAREVKWSQQVYRGGEVIVGDYQNETAGDEGSCNLCLVAIEGVEDLVRACSTKASDGLIVRTTGVDIVKARQSALAKILAHHPHACLTCAQREGCSLTQCSSNVPEDQRCCILLNRCELGKVVDFVGLPDGTPKYEHEGFPKITDDFFFDRDYNLCIGCLRCVRICRDVRGVDALAATWKDGRIWVGTSKPGSLPESDCRFCGACVEVCPTGALLDKPDSKPVHPGDLAPCVAACPAGIDIPAYIRHVAVGDYKGALEVIHNHVPFAGILGYVCFHPCESECKRNTLGSSAAICALKRFVYETVPRDEIPTTQITDSTGKKVSIIGAGPAGLSAAFYLRRKGHEVDVYDSSQEPGGILRFAIPEYRLPQTVLDDELTTLTDLGIEFKTGMTLTQDFNIADLLNDGSNAVLVTIGASLSRKLGIPGEDLGNVIQTLDLLREIREGRKRDLTGKVVVIGGGNVAIDAAMSARRLGAENVTMVCLEQRAEMPAHGWEIDQALAEGIEILPGWGPVEFTGENGNVKYLLFQRCLKVFDDQGRFNPVFDGSDTKSIAADYAIIAIGQSVGNTGLKTGPNGLIDIDQSSFETDIKGVFAAGDAVSGPASVVEAVAKGRSAADSIDKFLGGDGVSVSYQADDLRDDPFLGNVSEFDTGKREIRLLPIAERIKGFDVIEQSLQENEARILAAQCLRCNLRATISPVILPPDKWLPLTTENVAQIPSAEGVYQLANQAKKVTKIVGTTDVRAALESEIDSHEAGTLFSWEEERMYSKRESELIQLYLQEYGEMPGGGGNDDLDDLF
ncbi:MAG: FAD-dependent oxidoreductase [bacterium]